MNLDDITQNAHYVTYAAAASTATFSGLHISDIAVMVSSLAAVSGAAIQLLVYLERRGRQRRRWLSRVARGVSETKSDGDT